MNDDLKELPGYVAGELAADAPAAAGDRLAACATRREHAESPSARAQHLTKVQFEAYAEARLKDPAARIHILECSACRQEAEDVRQVADLQKLVRKRTGARS